MATVVTVKAEGQPVNVVHVLKTGNTTTKELRPGQDTQVVVVSGESLRVEYPKNEV